MGIIVVLGFMLGKARRQIEELQQSNTDPIAAAEYKKLGEWAAEHGNMPLARKCHRKTAEAEAKTGNLPYKLGLSYFEAEQYQQAITELNKCLHDEVLKPKVYFYLAYAYLHIGDYDMAEQYFKAALQLKSQDPYIYVGLGVIAQYRQQPVQAKSYYEKALALDPNCRDARENLDQLR
jgi:Tfp pilus assembly protein PilF